MNKGVGRHIALFREGLKYISVGLVNTAVTVIIMAIFKVFGFHYVIYTSIAYAVGFVCSFVLNGVFTFRTGILSLKFFLWFLCLNFLILAVVQLVQILMIEVVALPEIVGVVVGMILYTGAGFMVNRKYVFYQHQNTISRKKLAETNSQSVISNREVL